MKLTANQLKEMIQKIAKNSLKEQVEHDSDRQEGIEKFKLIHEHLKAARDILDSIYPTIKNSQKNKHGFDNDTISKCYVAAGKLTGLMNSLSYNWKRKSK